MATKTTKDTILNGWKTELAAAAEVALKPIADAVREAKRDISQAASDAKQVVSAQASNDAARVAELNKAADTRNVIDHDLFVTLSAEFRLFAQEVRGWKEDTVRKIEHVEVNKLEVADSYAKIYKEAVDKFIIDHGTREREIEKAIIQIRTWGSALVVLIGILEVLFAKLWH